MSKRHSVDLGSMIEGIQRWVETESPTRDKAAVNRMIGESGNGTAEGLGHGGGQSIEFRN